MTNIILKSDKYHLMMLKNGGISYPDNNKNHITKVLILNINWI